MADEVIKESVGKETPVEITPSVDLSARVLLLETRVLLLEAKLSELEKQSIKTAQVLKEPKIQIYGTGRKPKH